MSNSATGKKRPAGENGPSTPPSPKRARVTPETDDSRPAFRALPVADELAKKYPWLTICTSKHRGDFVDYQDVIASMRSITVAESEALASVCGEMTMAQFKATIEDLMTGGRLPPSFVTVRLIPSPVDGEVAEGPHMVRTFMVPGAIVNMLPDILQTDMSPEEEAELQQLMSDDLEAFTDQLDTAAGKPIDFSEFFAGIYSMDSGVWISLLADLFPRTLPKGTDGASRPDDKHIEIAHWAR